MFRLLMACFLILVLWAGAAPVAHAMYSPTLGAFINRDPGLEPGKDGKLAPAVVYQQGRMMIRETGQLAPRPYGARGYHDGMSLYRAYFIPDHLDPSGLQTETIQTSAGEITIELTTYQMDGWGRQQGAANITFTPNSRCGCKKVAGVQWINDGSGNGWGVDNGFFRPGAGDAYYNYDPGTGTFITPPGGGTIGGPGNVQDYPYRSATTYWLTCFYCVDPQPAWLGCVSWMYDRTSGWFRRGWGGATPPGGPGLPGIGNPYRRD